MTVYARPAEREQIVVRLNSPARAAPASPPSPSRAAPCAAEIGDGTRIEFVPSSRTGNIQLTFKPRDACDGPCEANAPKPSPPVKAATKAFVAPRTSHADMPICTGDLAEDVLALDKRSPSTPRSEILEDLMAHAGGNAACDSAGRGGRSGAVQSGAEIGLAQIIEAWPRLPLKTRAAMLALLEPAGETKRPPIVPRRRSRKGANPVP